MHVETLFILLVPHLFSDFAPPLAKREPGRQPNNQKGHWFSKSVLRSFSSVSQLPAFNVLIPKTYLS